MSSDPLVTVIIPFYNGEAFLKSAIDSVLNQTFTNLELLLVNDGSTDASVSIVQAYTDPRLRVLHNEGNRGVIYSRNRGIAEARANVVALLDADDIAVPNRVEVQYGHLENNPQVMMLGGNAEVVDAIGSATGEYYRMPAGGLQVHLELLFRNVFVNSAVMFRKEAAQAIGGYRGRHAEDYDFAFRMAEHYQVDNLDKILVQYRLHDHNSSRSAHLMRRGEEGLVDYMHRRLGIPQDDRMQKTHLSFIRALHDFQPELRDYFRLFVAIKEGNDKARRFPQEALNRDLLKRWYDLIRQSRSRKAPGLFFKKPLFHPAHATFKMYRKLLKQALGIM